MRQRRNVGDTVETVVRVYVKATVPEQSKIDIAFQQPACFHNVPVTLGKTAVFGAFNELPDQHSDQQISPLKKGIWDVPKEPRHTVQL